MTTERILSVDVLHENGILSKLRKHVKHKNKLE